MAIYLDKLSTDSDRDLFGDRPAPSKKRSAYARQQVVFCPRCKRLASVFLGGGKTTAAARCPDCGGEVTTQRSRAAKLQLYDAIMKRNQALVLAAAHSDGDIDRAVEYAEYAAHTAFAMRLVPYGPEPKR